MPTAYHMVHYRRFDAGTADLKGQTLESLCRTALNTSRDGSSLWERPEDRLFDIGSSDGRRIFLNKVADLSSAVFGEMCLAQNKDLQALLNMTPAKVQLSDLTTAVVYDLNEREAPSGSEFIRGLAYWLSIGNHLFFVKTHSMSADLIQQYMDWLLKRCTSVVDPALLIGLQAEFDNSQVGGDIGDIRSLRVAGKATPQIAVNVPVDTTDKEVNTSRRVADRIAQMAQAVPIIEALLGKPKAESLVDSLGPNEYLAVEATVKVRGRRTEASKAKLQSIANDLADMSDAKVQIEGKDGRVLDGDALLRTRMPFHQPHEGSNLLEFENVADQLQEVYARFAKDGKIKA
ncbi:hypothetical protein COO09_09350 [Rhizorhabdus dicambivorans]|uniref:Uncharacterized protein n=2 Tax=Rhizorhabdus dicambivorans TaxID=1850238 RepID=A0A2A4FYW4_9SPHN|nr:hypothetical protein CMV14_06730 [Rhizorhabdus dicambivorans]PCE42684.1 hypothetical protein COO09_09350 [Rhizorhabdus dicambivorans]